MSAEQTEVIDRLEGRNPVMEAIKANRHIDKILIQKGSSGSIKKLISMARQQHIVVQEVEKQKLDSQSVTKNHQGVIAYVAVHDYVNVDDILQHPNPFVVILDEITDPHNFGAILRTADACGVHGIIIPKRRSVGLTASTAKASAGAVEYVPVAKVSNIAQTIDALKQRNIWVAGALSEVDGGQQCQNYFECDLNGSIALVIGSEGNGISRIVREKCDFLVSIPMRGKINSLNASVAAALLMYEAARQRHIV